MANTNKKIMLSLLIVHGLFSTSPNVAYATANHERVMIERVLGSHPVIMKRFTRKAAGGFTSLPHKRIPSMVYDAIMIDGNQLQISNRLFSPNEFILLKVLSDNKEILFEYRFTTSYTESIQIEIPQNYSESLEIMLESAKYIYIGNITL